jgi:hypothetical protein
LLLGRHSIRARNAWILVASYFFYGWWDWRLLGLLLFSSVVDFGVSLGLRALREDHKRRLLLAISLVVNLGVLGFFKYYNFFVASLIYDFALLDVELRAPTLKVILPAGLSFNTFQELTYTIHISRRRLTPTPDPLQFMASVSVVPLLVAGPIERASHLLPHFARAGDFTGCQPGDARTAVQGHVGALNSARYVLWRNFSCRQIATADSTCNSPTHRRRSRDNSATSFSYEARMQLQQQCRRSPAVFDCSPFALRWQHCSSSHSAAPPRPPASPSAPAATVRTRRAFREQRWPRAAMSTSSRSTRRV